jgi:hypothetical protein
MTFSRNTKFPENALFSRNEETRFASVSRNEIPLKTLLVGAVLPPPRWIARCLSVLAGVPRPCLLTLFYDGLVTPPQPTIRKTDMQTFIHCLLGMTNSVIPTHVCDCAHPIGKHWLIDYDLEFYWLIHTYIHFWI